MAKKSIANKKKKKKAKEYSEGPWLPMRTGLLIIAVVSVGMGVFIGWNAIQTQGLVNGILWGFAYAIGVWGVFAISILFNRYVRGKRS